jgi:hypothetical protein
VALRSIAGRSCRSMKKHLQNSWCACSGSCVALCVTHLRVSATCRWRTACLFGNRGLCARQVPSWPHLLPACGACMVGKRCTYNTDLLATSRLR